MKRNINNPIFRRRFIKTCKIKWRNIRTTVHHSRICVRKIPSSKKKSKRETQMLSSTPTITCFHIGGPVQSKDVNVVKIIKRFIIKKAVISNIISNLQNAMMSIHTSLSNHSSSTISLFARNWSKIPMHLV